MAKSLFGGANDNRDVSTKSGGGIISPGVSFIIGHVKSITYDGPVPGEIKFKPVFSRSVEDTKLLTAVPADSNFVKYPAVDELVIIISTIGDDVYNNRFLPKYSYIATLTSKDSGTYNGNPNYSINETIKTIESVDTPELQSNPEKEAVSPSKFFNPFTGIIKQRKLLQPYEGDTILQGRFGASIRLGSSGVNDNSPWSVIGRDGDPIIVMSTDRDTKGDVTTKIESVNDNDSSIYICSSQTVQVLLSTSANLKTYRHIYDVPDEDSIKTTRDLTSFVETPEEEVALYQERAGLATDVTSLTTISTTGNLQQIIDSVTDDMLDMLPGKYYNNRKGAIELAQVDGYAVEKTVAKAYIALKAAAKKDNVTINLTSGYRPSWEKLDAKSKKGVTVTATSQVELRNSNLRSQYRGTVDPSDPSLPSRYFSPATAPPGASKHGDGLAIDVNTSSRKFFSRVLKSDVYKWMVANSYKFGFVRTVSSEEWHYEFQPSLASKGPYGGIGQALKDKKSRNSLLFYTDLNLDTLA